MTTPNNMRINKQLSRLALPALLAIVLAACASMPPPTSELAVSTAAVAHAAGAGANEAAPIDMTSARDKLARANKAMVDKDYKLALSLALEAQSDARLAESKADAARAQKAADAVKADSEALREELARKVK
jgi:hypothetical protein